jgi:hypothetical protein
MHMGSGEETMMWGTVLLVALTVGQVQPDKAVTDAEKAQFLDLLKKLPTRGESFSDEAVTKAVPYTRVLLALTERDLDKRDLYPFLALSGGMVGRKEPREYAVANFQKIEHPTIKLIWASALFNNDSASPEVVAYLRKALDSRDDAQTLSSMTGPGFEEFRARVIRAYEIARPMKVSVAKRHTIDALPEYGGGFDYTKESLVVAPGRLLFAVHPLKQQGELTTYDLAKGTMARLVVPQPAGVQAEPGFLSRFSNPVLSVNSRGDLLCRWTIGGNGDHGLALLKKGSASFLVKRVEAYLADCQVIAAADGGWYLVQVGPEFTVYRIGQGLTPTRLGSFPKRGHHSIRICDARFIAGDVLHLFWGDVLTSGNHLRVRCIDFDVKQKRWLHDREIFRLDRFTSSANEPTVLQFEDGTLHYLWRVDEGAKPGDATGLYYQAESDVQTVKVAKGYDYRAANVGDRIVVCYTQRDAPEKVFFRVILHGTAGPVSEIEAAKGRTHPLSSEDMVLHADAGRLWFVNTLARNTLYELELVGAKTA